jgi:hypothetical protein
VAATPIGAASAEDFDKALSAFVRTCGLVASKQAVDAALAQSQRLLNEAQIDSTCPLCCENFTQQELGFFPCKCGYKVGSRTAI